MHALDNVIWHALATRQSAFAETSDQASRFPRAVTALAALLEPSPRGYASLAGLLEAGGTATLSLASPYQPQPGWDVIAAFPGLQMVAEKMVSETGNCSSGGPDHSFAITELTQQDSPEMIELATLTKPGPFGIRTYELGRYVGIRSEGKLIAMAGERLKVPGYTEVSAVCTHPEHTGRGYARGLMMEIMRGIRERGETPFLHVRRDNARAVGLYETLGFRTRMVVHFTVLRKG